MHDTAFLLLDEESMTAAWYDIPMSVSVADEAIMTHPE
jgi:hypothetical protein